ncbi:MAG: PhoH family protein [archaeon]
MKPRDHYQNCFLDLLDNENIDLVTVQSQPGKGKTFLSLASALYQTFEKKRYDKIYIVKSNYEIGNTLGYLPGSVSEKTMPYFKPILNFIEKLHKKRSLPDKVFDRDNEFQFNTNKIEFVPINYMRGVDIENSFVIIDEIQNLSRSDARSLLSRMGSNTKCICTGDIHQIDNPYLDSNNNAMNWIVKLFKGQKNYAHIVLKGKQTRGAICKMVIDCKL